jgi:hypothetical protein
MHLGTFITLLQPARHFGACAQCLAVEIASAIPQGITENKWVTAMEDVNIAAGLSFSPKANTLARVGLLGDGTRQLS